METDICILPGERIREVRKDREWRQIDLAAHSGVNVIYLSDLENGPEEVFVRTLQVIATAFDMTITESIGPIGL